MGIYVVDNKNGNQARDTMAKKIFLPAKKNFFAILIWEIKNRI
jgi:hypothetical protein